MRVVGIDAQCYLMRTLIEPGGCLDKPCDSGNADYFFTASSEAILPSRM
jgi:hypothetical protein